MWAIPMHVLIQHSLCVSAFSCLFVAKMPKLIEMPFRGETHVGEKNCVLEVVYMGTTWQIQLNGSCSMVTWAATIITVATCCYFETLSTRNSSHAGVGTKLTEYKVDEEAVATIAMEVGVAKREAEIVRCLFSI